MQKQSEHPFTNISLSLQPTNHLQGDDRDKTRDQSFQSSMSIPSIHIAGLNHHHSSSHMHSQGSLLEMLSNFSNEETISDVECLYCSCMDELATAEIMLRDTKESSNAGINSSSNNNCNSNSSSYNKNADGEFDSELYSDTIRVENNEGHLYWKSKYDTLNKLKEKIGHSFMWDVDDEGEEALESILSSNPIRNDFKKCLKFLHPLPPIICIHLSRLVYDEKTGYMKKISERVQFPPFLTSSELVYPDKKQKHPKYDEEKCYESTLRNIDDEGGPALGNIEVELATPFGGGKSSASDVHCLNNVLVSDAQSILAADSTEDMQSAEVIQIYHPGDVITSTSYEDTKAVAPTVSDGDAGGYHQTIDDQFIDVTKIAAKKDEFYSLCAVVCHSGTAASGSV